MHKSWKKVKQKPKSTNRLQENNKVDMRIVILMMCVLITFYKLEQIDLSFVILW